MATLSATVPYEALSAWLTAWREGRVSATDEELVQRFQEWTQVVRDLRPSSPSPSPSPVRLILNVMMKNEQPVMARCLQSACGVVDAVCYSDTGSTGDVFRILRDTLPASLPWDVEIEPWRDFGYNRTCGLEQTRRFALRQGWDLDRTYALLLDADMVLEADPALDKASLTEGGYLLQQRNGSIVYWNLRVARLSQGWHSVGRTHEYYASSVPCVPPKCTTLRALDLNDGCNRAHKFDRDIELLTLDLNDDPRNVRSLFYLGMSHQNRCRSEADLRTAIDYYQRHAAVQTWDEERFFALYAIGTCYEGLQDEARMAKAYLAAYQFRPTRLEPLYKLGKYYRDRDQHWTALLYFRTALTLPQPSDVLFVDEGMYRYHLPSDLGVSAFFTHPSDRALGHRCLQYLVLARDVPGVIRDLAYCNLRFYLQPMKGLTFHALQPRTLPPFYVPCNPSLVMGDDDQGLVVLCRGVNYSQQGARNYRVRDPAGGPFHTANVLMHCTAPGTPLPLAVVDETRVETPGGPCQAGCSVQGLEDGRLVRVKGQLAFSCTSLEHTPNHSPRLCWATLDEAGRSVTRVQRLHGHEDDRVQKNWLPWVQDGQVYFVYGYHPFTLLRLDPDTGRVEVVRTTVTSALETAHWRGSAGPVRWKQGYLLLVHEVCDRPEGRVYMHRWVQFDAEWNITHVSDLLYIRYGEGVEMVTGLVVWQDRLLLTLGVEDREAWLVEVPREEVDRCLYPCSAVEARMRGSGGGVSESGGDN